MSGSGILNHRSMPIRCENISIRGDGHFEGQGKKWWDFMRSVNAKQPVDNKWQEIFGKENETLLSTESVY